MQVGTAKKGTYETDAWETPDADYFAPLNERYHFVCDLYANATNTKVPGLFFTRERSALEHEWPRLSLMDAVLRAPPVFEVLFDAEAKVESVTRLETKPNFPADAVYGWNFANPAYKAPNLDLFTAKAIEQARLGCGIVAVIPATPGTGWFQNNLLKRCDVLDAYRISDGKLSGYELSMQGIGYRQKVRFIEGRIPFIPPPGYTGSSPGASVDSILWEVRPPLR